VPFRSQNFRCRSLGISKGCASSGQGLKGGSFTRAFPHQSVKSSTSGRLESKTMAPFPVSHVLLETPTGVMLRGVSFAELRQHLGGSKLRVQPSVSWNVLAGDADALHIRPSGLRLAIRRWFTWERVLTLAARQLNMLSARISVVDRFISRTAELALLDDWPAKVVEPAELLRLWHEVWACQCALRFLAKFVCIFECDQFAAIGVASIVAAPWLPSSRHRGNCFCSGNKLFPANILYDKDFPCRSRHQRDKDSLAEYIRVRLD